MTTRDRNLRKLYASLKMRLYIDGGELILEQLP